MNEGNDMRRVLGKRIEARRSYAATHGLRWRRFVLAFRISLVVALILDVVGIFAILFVIYAIFLAPGVGA